MTVMPSESVTNFLQKRVANPVMRRRGRWHIGTAHLVPEDDAQARLRELPQFNSFGVRTFGTNLLTVRVDLA
jgi:hypothetical protein